MKKSQKWIIILIMIALPIIIISTSLLISNISIKEVPVWAVIGIPVFILVSPFTFLLAQRTIDAPLQKQKKMLLTVLCVYIIFSAIILILMHYVNYQFFWVLFAQFCVVLPFPFHRYRMIKKMNR